MTQRDDNPGNANEQAAATSAPAGDAHKSAVDFSDLDAQQEAEAKQAEADERAREGDKPAKTGTEGEDGDDDGEKDPFEDPIDDDGAEDDDDENDEGEDEKPRKKSRNARYRDQIARLKDENEQLRSRQGGRLTDQELAARVEEIIGPEPQEKDFEDYLAWEREHTAWTLDKRQVTRQVKADAGRELAEHRGRLIEKVDQHKERVADFRSRNGKTSEEDYDAVMKGAKDLKVSPVVEELVLDSKKSAHLQYYFAKNPDRLSAINQMGPVAAAREIGRIESRLSLPKPRTETRAPKPSERPRGGASAYNADADLEGYLKKTYGG